MSDSIAISLTSISKLVGVSFDLDLSHRQTWLRRSLSKSVPSFFFIPPKMAQEIVEAFDLLEDRLRDEWQSLSSDERHMINYSVYSFIGIDRQITTRDKAVLEFALLFLLSWASLVRFTNFAAIYKKKTEAILELVTNYWDTETKEYLGSLPISDHWLDNNSEAKTDLELGLEQASKGEVCYLGSFAQYTDIEIDD
jgi:hypothetical protein